MIMLGGIATCSASAQTVGPCSGPPAVGSPRLHETARQPNLRAVSTSAPPGRLFDDVVGAAASRILLVFDLYWSALSISVSWEDSYRQ